LSTPQEDIVMKSIVQLFRDDAIKFFGIDKKIVSAGRTEYSHLQLQRNIDDWMLLADDDSYIHLEFQTTDKKKDLSRFMVSDAILYYQEGKPVKTIVVYSSDIEETNTTLDCGSIKYEVDAFYMVKLDGDKTYTDIKAKIDAGTPLTKHDLMSIVFLPLMKNSVDRETRLEHSIELSKEIKETEGQLQIQAMISLLAEKFVTDKEILKRLKELINMGVIAEMIRKDEKIETAKNALLKGLPIDMISDITGLDESTIRDLEAEIAS